MLDRIVLSDNGTLTDITETTNTYGTTGTSHAFVSADDAIYIGSRFPMSEKYFKASGGVTGTLTVEYWDGTSFRAMVDTRDGTSGLSTSGYLKFTPDRSKAWSRADTGTITELDDLTIYDQYWLKITVSADATIDLAWIGDLFSTDNDIEAEYPDLLRPAMLTGFKAGKVDWEEQRAIASGYIVEDLMARNAVRSSNQLFEVERFRRASVIRTAMIIFKVFGSDYDDDFKRSKIEYADRFNALSVLRDDNSNALEDPKETHRDREIFLHL